MHIDQELAVEKSYTLRAGRDLILEVGNAVYAAGTHRAASPYRGAFAFLPLFWVLSQGQNWKCTSSERTDFPEKAHCYLRAFGPGYVYNLQRMHLSIQPAQLLDSL